MSVGTSLRSFGALGGREGAMQGQGAGTGRAAAPLSAWVLRGSRKNKQTHPLWSKDRQPQTIDAPSGKMRA